MGSPRSARRPTSATNTTYGSRSCPPGGQLRDPYVVFVADVGRRADRGDPIRLRLQGHRYRILDVLGAVVDAGEQVTVEVDRGANLSKDATALAPSVRPIICRASAVVCLGSDSALRGWGRTGPDQPLSGRGSWLPPTLTAVTLCSGATGRLVADVGGQPVGGHLGEVERHEQLARLDAVGRLDPDFDPAA